MTRQFRIPVVGRALPPVGSHFVTVEALGGTVLLVATLAAFVWANVAGGSYEEVWAQHLTIGLGSFDISQDLRHWVNDGLMTLFFFVVGLEIKRELVHGELRDRRTASLPAIAALGGMVVPALLYTAVNAGGAASRGWAIPMATDIAFAVAVLGVLGPRVPNPLRVFLLTLAIVDDIGAILVIALFYSDDIALGWLLAALGVIGIIVLAARFGVTHPIFYVLPALALWVCAYESGIHPTIAGVALALLTPARRIRGREVIEGLERGLHPWSSFLVIPLFALANAGIRLDSTGIDRALTSEVTWGIIIGLVIGKPLGIVVATSLGTRLRLGRLPAGLQMRHVLGAGFVAGIGFTVSLFVADLSFGATMLNDAKMGIVAASLVSAAVGGVYLFKISLPAERSGAANREADR